MHLTGTQNWAYGKLMKPLFFVADPEKVHDRIIRLGAAIGRSGVARRAASWLFSYQHPALQQTVNGIRFPNPIGLAAGFDKNAELIDVLPSVGFGFMEIGSVTGEPCAGNAKPRLWRLPESRGLVVNYGLKNEGCDAIAARLSGRSYKIPLGTSIAKTNSEKTVRTEDGIADYARAFRAFAEIGDYTTVNISCPNAFGGEPFSDPVRLNALLDALDEIPTNKPVFLKVTPDSGISGLDAALEVASRHRVHGLVISNLTKNRDTDRIAADELKRAGSGGISGKPVETLSSVLIAHARKAAGGRFTIIGVGGIFSAEDAYEKITRGASLVQLITGMIYQGPQLIGEINRGLVRLCERDGFSSISQAVGSRTSR
ncbi:quinone-dependent dihydroorotate dehydrogenase [Patescibacteria group bacterium]|nr:quinone-dependent dihydroorotate dehydrogenase [Patescibacteria group bacterium]MBU1907945.1 quinone-dependent dihydroorotate dehydrogenase [Patescibacteria group bacterium]